MNAIDIGTYWYSYEFSLDATNLKIKTSTSCIEFRNIIRISFYPVHLNCQVNKDELDKEIYKFIKYNLVDCVRKRIDVMPNVFDNDSIAIQVGPNWNCVSLVLGSIEDLEGYVGFYFSAERIELSIICRDYVVT